MKLFFGVFVIVLLSVQYASAIRCYNCTNTIHAECAWPDSQLFKSFTKDCGPHVTKCSKVVQKYPNIADRIIRECAYNEVNRYGNALVLFCDSDNCNGSSKNTIQFVTILTLGLLPIVKFMLN